MWVEVGSGNLGGSVSAEFSGYLPVPDWFGIGLGTCLGAESIGFGSNRKWMYDFKALFARCTIGSVRSRKWMYYLCQASCSSTFGFGSNRKWMDDLCQASFSRIIGFGSNRKWMYDLFQTSFSRTIGFGSNRKWIYNLFQTSFSRTFGFNILLEKMEPTSDASYFFLRNAILNSFVISGT